MAITNIARTGRAATQGEAESEGTVAVTKHNIYLCQVNNRYGDNVFLPHSVGMLQAYCLTIKEIAAHFEFKGFVYLREDPARVAARLENPKIIGISCYIWNWEYSKLLAQSIKARHPDCIIILGGPQVPLRSEGFFVEHPYADILVHYEGELPFADILLEFLSPQPDYTKIPGLSVKTDGLKTYKTAPRERNLDLSRLPSPYLTGTFDDLLTQSYSFHASQETHRGCPYTCTFCDWGSAVLSKVRAFDDRRLEEELKWFGRHKIDLLYNCDANYGLLPRDYALTVKLAEAKAKYGYPRKFRAAYAKNSSKKIFEIAKVLHQADMSKGVTLSFQSLDDRTLEFIKRQNIKIDDFAELMRMYRNEGIPTYTEVILGLPGETYQSFVEGINRLIATGQHDSLNIYTCIVLPNAEMGDPAYRELHKVQTVRVPVLLIHSTPAADPITEYNDVVVGTRTMPEEDWRRVYLFSWAIQCFHCLSLTQYLAVFLFTEFGLPYSTFYEKLLEFAEHHPDGPTGRQYLLVSDILASIMQESRGWDVVIPRFGDVVWPPEEGAFLNIIYEKSNFYGEMRDFGRGLADEFGLAMGENLLADLLTYQANMIIDPFSPKTFSVELGHNLHDYFLKAYLGEPATLARVETTLDVQADAEYEGDLETYARNVIWYGRKGGRFRHSNVTARTTSGELGLTA